MRANELSCKDLMIGDYVRHKKTKDIIWIFEIDDDRKVINNESDGYCSERNISINDIEPIIITPEILEKNFEIESNIFGLQTYKLNESFNLENRGDRFCLVRKCRVYYTSTFWICDLVHLHQLQHALKLCGIEKEIKLED